MKKILSLALAGVMMFSALPVAYAAEGEHDYTNGTTITLNGSGTEAWTVTVPAKLSPVAGSNAGKVKAEGTWAADKFLNVGAPSTVTLTYGAQTMDVAVTGGSFSLIGNSVDPVSKEVDVSIEEASRLFGTWEGLVEYKVELIEKGDVNRDGVITDADRDAIAYHLLTPDMEGYKELTAEEIVYADVDGNGTITAFDKVGVAAILLSRYYPHAVNGTAATE